MMRYLLFLSIFLIKYCGYLPPNEIEFADNPVIAHRGAWKAEGLPQNSIASLKHAISLNCTGSEFDVRMTADDVLIVTHDHDYDGKIIEETSYEDLAITHLPNGEKLPTLKDYILAGMKDNNSTGLVCEVKPSKIEGRNILITDKILDLVDEIGADGYISAYISFSYEIIKHIENRKPEAITMYLDGSKAPEKLKEDEVDGLDYHFYKFKMKPEWISNSHILNLILNAWTVNNVEDIDWLLANNFDFITTDEPELVFERIKVSPTTEDWKLVWSDEFNYNGKPDSTKWGNEIGFIRNKEAQYYSDAIENARVEEGILILETHKEKISNVVFVSEDENNWKKNKAFGDYTAASLTTKGIAAWKYGRIDIKAKLPKGVGMWPAFWMLGENYSEVGWPECGEIDIMEHVGYEPEAIYGTIHTKTYNHLKKTEKGKSIFVKDPYDTFHTYTIEWTSEEMSFFLDGERYNYIKNEHKSSAEWPFDQKFHLKLNVAVGGAWGGQQGIDDDIFPNQMIIDYVRVFQKTK